MDNIVHRIENDLGVPSLADKLSNELSPSDFNSLLTDVFASRTEKAMPNEMLKKYSINQYAKPASCNAVQYRRLEMDMLLAAEERGVQGIILSPASLLGCCSVFGAVSQNKVISATRNLEILSDATNMLTLYIAAGIKDGSITNANALFHLCTTHRHIRYQAKFRAGMLPHFGIFTMASAGKSRSSYAFEIEALLFQLRFYRDYWVQKHGSVLFVSFNRRAGYKDTDGFFNRVIKAVKENIIDMEILIDEQENNTRYYTGIQATLYVQADGKDIEIGDIGFTDWTQKLLNNSSERLLISAMALDRQMSLQIKKPFGRNSDAND